MQPTFAKFFPVAIMIGLFAGAVVYFGNMLSASFPWTAAVWVPFISWALYFAEGAKLSRFHKYLIGMVGGILLGWLTIVVGNALGATLGAFAYPVTVFCVATCIVLLELTDWFELAPAYFFGYAGFFAYAFGNYPMASEHMKAAGVYTILTIVGLIIGAITATLRGKILDVLGVPQEQRSTIFDKE